MIENEIETNIKLIKSTFTWKNLIVTRKQNLNIYEKLKNSIKKRDDCRTISTKNEIIKNGNFKFNS
jgi:hypothetical protein